MSFTKEEEDRERFFEVKDQLESLQEQILHVKSQIEQIQKRVEYILQENFR